MFCGNVIIIYKTFIQVNIEAEINQGNKQYRLRVILANINEAEVNKPITNVTGDAYVPLISDNYDDYHVPSLTLFKITLNSIGEYSTCLQIYQK